MKLTQLNPRVEGAIGTQNVHVRLAVVALVGLVDLGLSKDNHARAQLVPLELDLVALEEGLLGHGTVELRDLENLHCGGGPLGRGQ